MPLITLIKSRKVRWAENVERMGKSGKVYKVFVGKPEGRDHSEDLV